MCRHNMRNGVTLNTCDIVHNIWKTHGKHLRFPFFRWRFREFCDKNNVKLAPFFLNMTCPQLLVDYNPS